MKKLLRNALMLSAMGSVLFFTSCDDEGGETLPTGPTVSLDTELEDSYGYGEEVDLTFSFEAQGQIGQIVLSDDLDGTAGSETTTFIPSELGLSNEDTTGTFGISVTLPESGELYTLNVEIIDRDNQSSSINVEFPLSESISSYTQVLFGAQGNSNDGFYNSLDNQTYTYAEARDASGVDGSPVDFAYYWGEDNGNTLAAIDDAGLNSVYSSVELPIANIFGTRNSTRFRITAISAADFDDINSDAALLAVAESELNSNSSATDLSEGSVVAFELDEDRGGYFGLAKVVSIDDTNGNGTITIDVKVQVSAE